MPYTRPMALDKKKKRILLASVAVVVALLVGLVAYAKLVDNPFGSDAYKTLSPKKAQQLIQSRKDLMIVDIRGREELREGWIEGSVIMPMPEILQGRQAPPKDRPILLVCAVGGRSLALGKAMTNYGWNEVYNLAGGVAEWKRAGLPVRYR